MDMGWGEDEFYYDRFRQLTPDPDLAHRVLLLWECTKLPSVTEESKKEFLARVAYLYGANLSGFGPFIDRELTMIYEEDLIPLLKEYPRLLTHEKLAGIAFVRCREQGVALHKQNARIPNQSELININGVGTFDYELFKRYTVFYRKTNHIISDFIHPIGKEILSKEPRVMEFFKKDPRLSVYL